MSSSMLLVLKLESIAGKGGVVTSVGLMVVTRKETQIRWDCTDFVICVFFYFSHKSQRLS